MKKLKQGLLVVGFLSLTQMGFAAPPSEVMPSPTKIRIESVSITQNYSESDSPLANYTNGELMLSDYGFGGETGSINQQSISKFYAAVKKRSVCSVNFMKSVRDFLVSIKDMPPIDTVVYDNRSTFGNKPHFIFNINTRRDGRRGRDPRPDLGISISGCKMEMGPDFVTRKPVERNECHYGMGHGFSLHGTPGLDEGIDKNTCVLDARGKQSIKAEINATLHDMSMVYSANGSVQGPEKFVLK
jgi:hypothetical protein